MLKSKIFLGLTIIEVLLLALFGFSSYPLRRSLLEAELQPQKDLVRHLSLTDFAIWTEARYTRHPSQTDFFSPFQEFPAAFEHFPAGSIIAPGPGTGGSSR